MTIKNKLDVSLVEITFFTVVFAWSTSWIAIKFQLGTVAEGLSVAYRFFGAAIILLLVALIKKFPLTFTKKQHFLIFLQGINLFFFNHLFFYSGLHYVSSGVAATFASLSIILIPLIDFLIHKNKTVPKILLGAALGILGIALIASTEINFNNFDISILKGLFFCFLGALCFSFGSVIGKDLKLHNIKTLISSSAYSMLYGSILSLLYTIFIRNQNIAFDFSPSYTLSLLYLILIPGILGYCGILFLIEKIGSAKAAYTALLYPVFALIISGIFENYHFTVLTFIGIFLVAIGNLIALKSKKN